MSKLLSYDAIFAALAVVAASGGCAKSEAPKATAESIAVASAAPAAVAPTAAPAEAPAPPAPGVLVADPSPAPSAAPVDKGIENSKKSAPRGAAPAKPSKNAQAACGAGTCSADMKK